MSTVSIAILALIAPALAAPIPHVTDSTVASFTHGERGTPMWEPQTNEKMARGHTGGNSDIFGSSGGDSESFMHQYQSGGFDPAPSDAKKDDGDGI
ncbi:hypothetical protein FRB94_008928 [Tulasnella sp. JGI-2019a]|nr:hypothetical protein FRB93_008198 [Tulasnella sp. JGI-2019a]KAG8995562.1 hypothetical protein FRB94_008928 [Tulasnella sp. JGI-2019a]